jgi:heme/copper-type cytochrome/quinol oxidase subunit 2
LSKQVRARSFRRTFAAVVAAGLLCPFARATNWWLPPNFSEHGRDMDHLFNVIFWLTTVVMLGVFAVMLYFLIRYRHNPRRKKAHFSHGNPRVELIWTIIPAIILTYVSLYSKKVWDRYRHGDELDSRKPARVLVIGQQFQWNVVYPGPDGKIGKYLVYPKPSDKYWPRNADGTPFTFSYGKYQDTKGPSEMPFADAVAAINAYIEGNNPLGKVFDDPDGKDDDDGGGQPGRPIFLPKGRPVEIQLSSKDVIHDFFMPNMRVKLDAVPGLRGLINFVPTATSKEVQALPENRRTYHDLDALSGELSDPVVATMLIEIDEKSEPKAPNAKSAGKAFDRNAGEWKYNDKEGKTIVRDGQPLTPERVAQLKAIGVKTVTMYRPQFDLVCEELCGQGHGKMQGRVIVITAEEYAAKFETKAEEADLGQVEKVARAARP